MDGWGGDDDEKQLFVSIPITEMREDSCNVNQTSVGDSQNLIGFGREEDFSHVDEGGNSPDYASDSEEINQQEREIFNFNEEEDSEDDGDIVVGLRSNQNVNGEDYNDLNDNVVSDEQNDNVDDDCDDNKDVGDGEAYTLLEVEAPKLGEGLDLDLKGEIPDPLVMVKVDHVDLPETMLVVKEELPEQEQLSTDPMLMNFKDDPDGPKQENSTLDKGTYIPGGLQKGSSTDDVKKFACDQCNYSSNYKANLCTHKRNMHPPNGQRVLYPCNKCDKVFKTPLATYRHKQSVHDGKRYNCTECEYVGKRSDDLKRHSQSQHEGFKYVCPECNYVVTTPSGLMNHKRKIHDGIKYTCDLCDKYSGTTATDLKRHKTTIHEGIRIPCPLCSYCAATKSCLRRHTKVKHDKVKLLCDKCEYFTYHHHNLKIHNESKHEGIVYPCDQCEYKAFRPDKLTHHIESKHLGITYTCDLCSYSATRKGDLGKHKKIVHEGQPAPFQCTICKYSAHRKNSLTKHMKKAHNEVTATSFIREDLDDFSANQMDNGNTPGNKPINHNSFSMSSKKDLNKDFLLVSVKEKKGGNLPILATQSNI